MATIAKAYKGIPMEGAIASWYARNTGVDRRRFTEAAQRVTASVGPRSHVLEVAPGPGYLAIDLAGRGYDVTAVDISRSFVRMTGENAARAGVTVDVRHGNASDLPLADSTFDFVICMAAFKNFTDPLGAINEMHRVLKPGREAAILDLRKDATREEIDAEVRNMHLSPLNAWLTRSTFQFMLLRSAYTREQLAAMAAESRFGGGTISAAGIGCELRLTKAA